MIKEKELKINITPRNVTHFKKRGYDVNIGDVVNVKVVDLSKNSHQMVTAVCECGNENKIRYHKYIENVNRCGYYGCKKCSNKKREIICLEKYGVTNYQKTDECKEKVAKNNIRKYGVKTTLLEENTKKKIDDTIWELYGVKNILSSTKIREKGKKTLLDRYGVDHYSKTIDFYKKTYKRWKKDILKKLDKYNIIDFVLKEDRTVDIKCDCGEDHYFNITSKNLYQRKEIQNTTLCTICNSLINTRQSVMELEILDFIKENYDGMIIENDKEVISELDIYLPEIKIGIEFNGIYWHSDLFKDKFFHLNKTEKCEKLGVQVIHIYEDEWLYKQNIVKSMLLNKLGKMKSKIYARKCQIKIVEDNELVSSFLDKNHIQGFVGSSIKIGLFYDNNLISIMTFGKKHIDDEYELVRFCNELNTTVIGAASKLFKYFIDKYKPKKIISYVDRSWSQGNMHYKLGFNYINKTPPNYSYYDSKHIKYNRFNFRKDVLVRKGYDKNKTESEIMTELGYLRVYNSGKLKFEINF